MQNAKNWFYSREADLFNQIAMFSITGLSFSMAMAIAGGFRILHPWF